MFEVSSAKQKAGKEEPPTQASMRASSNEKIRRNPSTDQRKVRRQMSKKAAYKTIVEPDVNRDEWHAWRSPDGWATAFYLPDGSRVVIQGRADADQFQADNPEAELASSTHNPGRYSSLAKVAWSIEDARQVLSGGAQKVDGMLLDHFSASALVQIFDALSPENQAKLSAMSLDKAMDIVWKLAKGKTGSQHTASITIRVEDIESDSVGIGTLNGERIRLQPWQKNAGRPGDETFDQYEKDDWMPWDGEPKYPELAEDDDDLFYDDFAHEASVSPFDVTDPTDTRPLHSRVAAAFLKKG